MDTNTAAPPTKDQQRRALIYTELKRQFESTPGTSDNEEIIRRIRAAGLLSALTPEDICRAVQDYERRRLKNEIEEVYMECFWIGADEPCEWTYVPG